MQRQPDIYSQLPERQGLRHQRAASTWVEKPSPPVAVTVRAPNSLSPVAVKVRAEKAPAVPISSAVDELMLEILRSPALPSETVEIAFRRKEAEMIALCASLSPIESMQLAKRLERAKEGDELATAFSRMIRERRQRIVWFLNDARRRAALAGRK